MENFTFYNPTKIIFGNGVISKVHESIDSGVKKILIICAKGPFRENGTYQILWNSLQKTTALLHEMPDIDQNPKLSLLQIGANICRENEIDCIVALGGGSVLDAAKIIAASAAMNIDPYELIWGSRPCVTQSLKVITIPTIAATGTEINNAAVAVNDKTKEKYWCETFFPKVAIMDPEITLSLPVKLTIWGAMDILSHTFEYYFNGNNQSEYMLRYAEAILLTTMHTINKIIQNPEDLNARGELMWCATMAWGGSTKIGQGAPDMTCHSIEESFSGFFDNHHGACLVVFTPNCMKMVFPFAVDEFARFAHNVMCVNEKDPIVAAELGIQKYCEWLKTIGAPMNYSDIGLTNVTKQQLEHVASNAWRIYQGKIGTLKKMTYSEICDILYMGMN